VYDFNLDYFATGGCSPADATPSVLFGEFPKFPPRRTL
jgi:hypothetical protein